jgi:hypothetical protein
VRRTGIAAALAVGVLATALTAACGSAGNGLDVSSGTTAATVSTTTSAPPSSAPATTTATAPTTATTPPAPPAPWVIVNAGRFAEDSIAAKVQAYGAARTQAALSYNAALPAFAAITTTRWQKFQGGRFANAKKKGWTTQRPARYAIVGISHSGSTARANVCLLTRFAVWQEIKTGKVVESLTPTWTPADFRFVLVKGGWKVDYIYDGRFSCKDAK